MPLAYTTVTFDVERQPGIEDPYGGEADSPQIVYSGLQGILSYRNPARAAEHLESSQRSQAAGPGTAQRTRAILIMEPKPSEVTIQRDDLVKVQGGRDWLVTGVREEGYERTLQLDIEAIQ